MDNRAEDRADLRLLLEASFPVEGDSRSGSACGIDNAGSGGGAGSHASWRDILADVCLCVVEESEARGLRGTSITGKPAVVGVFGIDSTSYFSTVGSLAVGVS